jgi:hypothetical protein
LRETRYRNFRTDAAVTRNSPRAAPRLCALMQLLMIAFAIMRGGRFGPWGRRLVVSGRLQQYTSLNKTVGALSEGLRVIAIGVKFGKLKGEKFISHPGGVEGGTWLD